MLLLENKFCTYTCVAIMNNVKDSIIKEKLIVFFKNILCINLLSE